MEKILMLDFLYRISDNTVFILMISATVTLSLMLIVLNRIIIFPKLKYKDNPTTASIAALIGIIYGVLSGFVCLYLLNNQDHATLAALNEGTAAANIYRDSHWLPQPLQSKIQGELKSYITKVINIEWPQMTKGKNPTMDSGSHINQISYALMHYSSSKPSETFIVQDILQEIKSLFKSRQERIEISKTQLSIGIWQVILLSTALIIVINYAFRVSLYLHVFTITAFAIMAASILFLLVTLDRPFQGEFIVEPDALSAVLDVMSHEENAIKKTKS